jgi:hypothetical protein
LARKYSKFNFNASCTQSIEARAGNFRVGVNYSYNDALYASVNDGLGAGAGSTSMRARFKCGVES